LPAKPLALAAHAIDALALNRQTIELFMPMDFHAPNFKPAGGTGFVAVVALDKNHPVSDFHKWRFNRLFVAAWLSLTSCGKAKPNAMQPFPETAHLYAQ